MPGPDCGIAAAAAATGELMDPKFRRLPMGNRIFGCDDCLDICPFNLQADTTNEPAFVPTPLTLAPNLQALAQLSAESFAATFKGSPLKRAKLGGLLRNVGIAEENHRRQTGGPAS